MSALNMSYSLLVLTADRLYAIRDPYGNRPLCVGTLWSTPKNGKAYYSSSRLAAASAKQPKSHILRVRSL